MADIHIEPFEWSFRGGLTSTGPTVISGTTTIGAGATFTSPTLASPTLTTPTINNPSITGPTPVAFTSGTTLALTQALHANRLVYVTDVAAAYVLPLATGTGDKYTIVLGATQTGYAHSSSPTSSGPLHFLQFPARVSTKSAPAVSP